MAGWNGKDIEVEGIRYPADLALQDLFCPDAKGSKDVGPKGGGDGDIGGVATAGDQDTPSAGRIVARVEDVPSIAQVDFKPSREVT